MKVIIVGCGRVGSRIALKLCEEGHIVAVIDRNPIAFDKLNGDSRINMVTGTGIDCDILECAGIRDADAVLSVAKGDNTNIMVAQIAQSIYRVPKVIARIVDPKVKKFYETEMGLACYCQTEVTSEHYIGMMKGEDRVCTSL